jgi:hypothetical protein
VSNSLVIIRNAADTIVFVSLQVAAGCALVKELPEDLEQLQMILVLPAAFAMAVLQLAAAAVGSWRPATGSIQRT